MNYFLGIDQGASKTAAIVGDEHGKVLGVGKSHGAVHSSDGMEAAMGACRLACEQALSEAQLSFSDIRYICGGLSGIDWKGDEELLSAALRDMSGVPEAEAVNDCIIAMRAGTCADDCATLCAGSGLNCAVRSKEKQLIFGFYIPDEIQGGYAIGNAALRKVFDSACGLEPETSMTGYILEYLKAEDVDSLLKRNVEGKIKAAQILYLPQIVEKAALEGDTAANNVLREFAQGIVPYLVSGMKQLGILKEKTDIVLSGSIFKCKAPVLLETVKAEILKNAEKANIINAQYEPVVGAYLMALDHYWGKPSKEIFDSIESNSNHHIVRQ